MRDARLRRTVVLDGSAGGVAGEPGHGDEEAQHHRVKATDVAARAQVSVATVSLVANGKAAGRVSESTVRRVQQAIEELGYVVNQAARSLATGRRQCVALVAQDMTNPFISAIAAGVAEALGTQTQLLLAVSGSGGQEPDLRHVFGADVDGVLLDCPVPLPQEAPEAQRPVVVMDDPKVADGSVKRLLRPAGRRQPARGSPVTLGHRTVMYLDTPRPVATFADRRRYLTDQLRRQHKDVRVLRAHSDIEIGAARAKVLANWPSWAKAGVTAIVAASDVQAYGVLGALADLKADVPGRVSVASFDDLPFAAIVSPPLTAISLPAFDLGFEAATLLQDIIERGTSARRTVVLPTRLTVRRLHRPRCGLTCLTSPREVHLIQLLAVALSTYRQALNLISPDHREIGTAPCATLRRSRPTAACSSPSATWSRTLSCGRTRRTATPPTIHRSLPLARGQRGERRGVRERLGARAVHRLRRRRPGGGRAHRGLAGHGVDVRVQRRGRTGTIVVLIDRDGERTMYPGPRRRRPADRRASSPGWSPPPYCTRRRTVSRPNPPRRPPWR